jgi:hypothetical protein
MATLTLEISSFWHVGSGSGDGGSADAVVARDAAGLPFVPGRLIKGLLRDACAASALADQTVELFGSAPPVAESGQGDGPRQGDDTARALEEGRYRTSHGRLHVTSAGLGEDWARFAAEHPSRLAPLFRIFSSTKLNEAGVAADKTLRSIELVVPMTLTAELTGLKPGELDGFRIHVLPRVRSFGSHRNRGLGRISMTLEG